MSFSISYILIKAHSLSCVLTCPCSIYFTSFPVRGKVAFLGVIALYYFTVLFLLR